MFIYIYIYVYTCIYTYTHINIKDSVESFRKLLERFGKGFCKEVYKGSLEVQGPGQNKQQHYCSQGFLL